MKNQQIDIYLCIDGLYLSRMIQFQNAILLCVWNCLETKKTTCISINHHTGFYSIVIVDALQVYF